MTGYTGLIRRATGCTATDAPTIERIMRLDPPTLDHLTRAEFGRLARLSQTALAELRKTDPETAAYFAEAA